MDLFGQKFAAVLFDLDGTLISSIDAVNRSWARVSEEFGSSVDRMGAFHGVPAKQLVERLLPDRSADEKAAALQRVTELETNDLEGIEVLPGALKALTELGEVNRCAVVTSCSRGLADARLGATELPVPAVTVTADDVTIGKPDPAPYLLGAERMGIDPSQCLVVEDAPAGCESGHAAGMKVLAVEITHERADLPADVIVPDLSAVHFSVSNEGIFVVKN